MEKVTEIHTSLEQETVRTAYKTVNWPLHIKTPPNVTDLSDNAMCKQCVQECAQLWLSRASVKQVWAVALG
jgi:hypothetical protein